MKVRMIQIVDEGFGTVLNNEKKRLEDSGRTDKNCHQDISEKPSELAWKTR